MCESESACETVHVCLCLPVCVCLSVSGWVCVIDTHTHPLPAFHKHHGPTFASAVCNDPAHGAGAERPAAFRLVAVIAAVVRVVLADLWMYVSECVRACTCVSE